MTVGVLVLAAGSSRRFGSDKRLAVLPSGKTMLEQTMHQIAQSGLPALVCLDSTDASLGQLLARHGVEVTLCQRAGEGMGSTLAEGAAQLPVDWKGVLVALGDMPWVEVSTYRAVAEQLTSERICRPVYEGSVGHPVGFGSRFFSRLRKLDGEPGARVVVEEFARDVDLVGVDDPGIIRDVDVAADLDGGSGLRED